MKPKKLSTSINIDLLIDEEISNSNFIPSKTKQQSTNKINIIKKKSKRDSSSNINLF